MTKEKEKTTKVYKVKVLIKENVKLNEDRYSLGQEVEVTQEEHDALLKAGVIDAE